MTFRVDDMLITSPRAQRGAAMTKFAATQARSTSGNGIEPERSNSAGSDVPVSHQLMESTVYRASAGSHSRESE